RAWRLAGASRQILPAELQSTSRSRKLWTRGLLATTGAYALALGGIAGIYRYEGSAHLLPPGVDPRREQEALVALNEGVAQFNKGDLSSSERSLQRSVRIWEELTAKRPVPSIYLANLSMTLYDLGLVYQKQGRVDQEEKFYTRAVATADSLADD